MPTLPTRKHAATLKAVPVLWHDSAWRLNIIVSPAVAVFNRLHAASSRRAKDTRKIQPAIPSLTPWRPLCSSGSLGSRRAFFKRGETQIVGLGRELLALAALPLRSFPPSRLQIRHLFQTTGCCL
jgi:hypothetical protein